MIAITTALILIAYFWGHRRGQRYVGARLCLAFPWENTWMFAKRDGENGRLRFSTVEIPDHLERIQLRTECSGLIAPNAKTPTTALIFGSHKGDLSDSF